MQLGFKIGLGLSSLHSLMLFADAQWIEEIFAISIYVPLMPFAYIGLPVFENSSGWGWASPSFLGYAFVTIFWLGIWLFIGYLIELISKQKTNVSS